MDSILKKLLRKDNDFRGIPTITHVMEDYLHIIDMMIRRKLTDKKARIHGCQII